MAFGLAHLGLTAVDGEKERVYLNIDERIWGMPIRVNGEMMEYKVISADKIEDIEEKIKERIEKGWEPLGGIVVDNEVDIENMSAVEEHKTQNEALRSHHISMLTRFEHASTLYYKTEAML